MTRKAQFNLKYVGEDTHTLAVLYMYVIKKGYYKNNLQPLIIKAEFMTSRGPLHAMPCFYVTFKGVW